jgi:shikimate kinase
VDNNRPTVIAGFMGSGKTSVAEALARHLDCLSVDLDHQITVSTGRSPREIIEQDGERAFRDVETCNLHDVLRSGGRRVIALGGGAWTLQRNRELISEYGGITVWLDVPFELCWERIRLTKGERPLAPDRDSTQLLYDERRRHYSLADLHIEVAADDSISEIAARIAENLQIQNK